MLTHDSTSGFNKALSALDPKQFTIPIQQQDADSYFPDFLAAELDRYCHYICHTLPINFDKMHLRRSLLDIPETVQELTSSIGKAVRHYYEGRVFDATQCFNQALKRVNFVALTAIEAIPSSQPFYRTRYSTAKSLRRIDLFHNPFENRHLVTTNRYSIPGFPALYLGSSVYVCWEEYNREPIRNLYFSKFVNTRPLNVAKIQRLEDFIAEERPNSTNDQRLQDLARYLALFPLSIACSIKTKELTGSFKPEYIIPQLLLQFISTHKELDGIMFPSTKVDYRRIQGVGAYNYVFPVKEVDKKGHCGKLTLLFDMTHPTSIELEDLISSQISYTPATSPVDASRYVEVVEGVQSLYDTTVWGRVEQILDDRKLTCLYDF